MIYFDHNATTIMHVEVQKLIYSLIGEALNPSSIHAKGRKARAIIEHSREQILNLVGANKRNYNLIFTGSGTESNNLILHNFKNADIFISATEHLSIFALKDYLPNIKLIKVDNHGLIDLVDLENNLKNSDNPKKLVSVMIANNETGVIGPLKEVITIAKNYDAYIHSDLAQGVGKININMSELGLDFATISAHKFGGPCGVGALIAKNSYSLTAQIIGGGQERGMRSGTENVIGIAGFGKAADVAISEQNIRYNMMKDLQEQLEQNLPQGFEVIAKDAPRLPNTSLLLAKNFNAQHLLIALDLENIMVSSGSACSSGKVGKSHVLTAMNDSEEVAKSTIRVSFSYHNNTAEITRFLEVCEKLNKMKKIA